ncbi:MAG: hypothetical protein HQK83_16310 [Fibrobacteria bacterium]|nr:hypothetical protein [Fibrobacteria bacterium]
MKYYTGLASLLFFISICPANKILFIRGGLNTGGFTYSGDNRHLCSIHDTSTAQGNLGWSEFADLLTKEGFAPVEITEGDNTEGCDPALNKPCSKPVPLDTMDLSIYSVIVFGSNNSRYDSSAVEAVWNYVLNGGGALFISDANFGRNWGDASNSDQAFLTQFGLIMNQDNDLYTVERSSGDFLEANHPILDSVNAFDGEGVTPLTVGTVPENVTVTILTRAKKQIRKNDKFDGGTLINPGTKDATLVVAEAGKGRIAGFFDRNTFFNTNGGGSDIHKHDNARLAKNLFTWLKREPETPLLRPLRTNKKSPFVFFHPGGPFFPKTAHQGSRLYTIQGQKLTPALLPKSGQSLSSGLYFFFNN